MDTRKMRILRAEKNLTQKQVAEKLGITVQAYNYAETGKRSLKIKTLIRYQQLMSLSDAEMWRLCSGKPDGKESTSH